MEELNMNEIKKEQLDILKVFKNYCEKNNMSYFLGYGTLLGAVRHKGYIPWDDDIDILMLRSDYDKFRFDFNKKNYKVYDSGIYPFIKLYKRDTLIEENIDHLSEEKIGINIDIFPIDKISNNFLKKIKKKWSIKFYKVIACLKLVKEDKKRKKYKNIILKISKMILIKIKVEIIIDKIKKIAEKDIKENYKVGCLVDDNILFEKNIFEKNTQLKFEDEKYTVPKDYNILLKCWYGDYMKIPKKELRISKHSFKAYRI